MKRCQKDAGKDEDGAEKGVRKFLEKWRWCKEPRRKMMEKIDAVQKKGIRKIVEK